MRESDCSGIEDAVQLEVEYADRRRFLRHRPSEAVKAEAFYLTDELKMGAAAEEFKKRTVKNAGASGSSPINPLFEFIDRNQVVVGVPVLRPLSGFVCAKTRPKAPTFWLGCFGRSSGSDRPRISSNGMNGPKLSISL